ncbi:MULTISPECIES: TetR/AcrR family transcriptional regulator [unclassified Nocardia]|uniref:TetR/AcrR family transcriptional regulator n=1 Tax=unclassified Nocardia TaxID=2637762 RepID=UPI001CE40392|nr:MULTISPECIES: TetR/AcrR family transcriptional regulator [unclassified Nocardia]
MPDTVGIEPPAGRLSRVALPTGETTRGGGPAKTRSDAQRSIAMLIDAVGGLLESGRLGFSVPELAGAAGVGVATAYRHFPTPLDAMQAFHRRAIEQLVAALGAIDPAAEPTARFHDFCRVWVAEAMRWGPAVRHIRSNKGFIERLDAGDESITALHDILADVLGSLVAQDEAASFEATYAVLLWITVFDERVIYDLTVCRGWSPERVTDRLTAAVAGALGLPV